MSLKESPGYSGADGFKWTRDITFQLIDLIKIYQDKLETGVKKAAYHEIANEINETHNTNLTYEQIDSKWKGLKKTYKKVREYNSIPRKSYRCWDFYDAVDEIVGHWPEMNAPAVMSTEGDTLQEFSVIDVKTGILSSPNVSAYRKRRRKVNTSPEYAREAASERRHRERMHLAREFLEVFKDLVDKM